MSIPQFLRLCVTPAMVFYTVLLLAMFVYWVVILAGLLDMASGTPEADAGVDLDADIDAGAGMELDADAGAGVDLDAAADMAADAPDLDAPDLSAGADGFPHPGTVGEMQLDEDKALQPARGRRGGRPARPLAVRVLLWLGVGRVPLLVFLSVFVPALWLLALWAMRWWGRSDGVMFGAFLVPNLCAAALASRALTYPLGLFFRHLNRRNADPVEDLSGQIARVVSLAADERYGQAELPRRGAPLALNVRTRPGEALRRDDLVRIVSGPDGRDVYLVEKADRSAAPGRPA